MAPLKPKGRKTTAMVMAAKLALLSEEVEEPKLKKGKKAKKVEPELVPEEASESDVEKEEGMLSSEEELQEVDDDEEEDGVEEDDDEEAESDEEDEEDGDEGEEEEEDVDQEEKVDRIETKTNLKRKQTTKTENQAKKTKTEDGDTMTVQFTDLPDGLNDSAFNKFLKSKGVRPVACRANYGKGKAFIDVRKWDKSKVLALNECTFNGARIKVALDEKEKKSPTSAPAENKPRDDRDALSLFCKNLPFDATEKEIAELFEGVKEVRILKSRDTGKSKGLCFVQFNSKEERKAGYALKDGLELDGRTLFLDMCGEKSQKPKEQKKKAGDDKPVPNKILFVKGITEDMTIDTLLKSFEGAIDARIPEDRETGKNRVFGYVEFESESDATSMYSSSKGGLEVEGTKLIVSYAEKRRDRGARAGGRDGRGRGRGRGSRRGGH